MTRKVRQTSEYSQDTDWRGVIIVSFAEGTSSERVSEIVEILGCKIQTGFEGMTNNVVVVVPKGKDEEYIKKFIVIPEVRSASLNNETVEALD